MLLYQIHFENIKIFLRYSQLGLLSLFFCMLKGACWCDPGIWVRCQPLEVFPNTSRCCWRDYIFCLAWERLGIPHGMAEYILTISLLLPWPVEHVFASDIKVKLTFDHVKCHHFILSWWKMNPSFEFMWILSASGFLPTVSSNTKQHWATSNTWSQVELQTGSGVIVSWSEWKDRVSSCSWLLWNPAKNEGKVMWSYF